MNNDEKQLVNGCIVEKNSIWQCVLYYKENGKRKQKWISTGISSKRGGKTEAKAILEKEINEQEQRLKTQQQNLMYGGKDCLSHFTGWEPFTDYLSEYLKYRSENEANSKKLSNLVADGYRRYVQHLKTYLEQCGINPAIKDLSTDIFNGFYFYLKQGRDGRSPLKNISITKYHCLFQGAINEALDRGLIVGNPLKKINKSYLRKEPYKAEQFNDDEAREFLQIVGEEYHDKNQALELAYNIALRLGLRRSEILALSFDEIDFERKLLRVRHGVKNYGGINHLEDVKKPSSRRVVPLPDKLLQMFKEQKEWIEKNKETYGNVYNRNYEGWGLDLVFVNEFGNLYNPDFLTKKLPELEEKYNLKKVTLHGLRHSCGSILYRNGVSIKTIQRILGHSDYKTTMDIYVDVNDDDLKNGVSVLDAKLKRAQDMEISGNDTADTAKFVKIAGDVIFPE